MLGQANTHPEVDIEDAEDDVEEVAEGGEDDEGLPAAGGVGPGGQQGGGEDTGQAGDQGVVQLQPGHHHLHHVALLLVDAQLGADGTGQVEIDAAHLVQVKVGHDDAVESVGEGTEGHGQLEAQEAPGLGPPPPPLHPPR